MEDFKAAAQAYLNDATFSDLTIVCGSKEYKSHRMIASSHSKWFQRCCTNGFAETASKKVELKDDKPEAVDRMIEFFYKFDYNASLPREYDQDRLATGQELQFHAWVLVVADKYEVPGLTKCALKKFKVELREMNHSLDALLSTAKILHENITAENDRATHDVLADAWILGGWSSAKHENHRTIMQALEQQPAFAVNIQNRLFNVMEQHWTIHCKSCDKILPKPLDRTKRRVECL